MMKVKIEKMSSPVNDPEDLSDNGADEGDEGEYDDYDLECKAKTLLEAEKIKADPKLMAALKPHLAQLAKAGEGIKSLADLKEVAAKKLSKKA